MMHYIQGKIFYHVEYEPALTEIGIAQGWATAFLCSPPAEGQTPMKHSHYVGQYHLPVNSPLDSLLDTNLTLNDSGFHYSPHPKTLFF